MATNIAKIRSDKGMSQVELADRIGISGRFEAGGVAMEREAVQIGDPDDNFPEYPAKNLYHGKFDADAGFAISKLVPDHISKWNNLGG